MMGLEQITAINREIAAEAARERRKPYVPDSVDEVNGFPPFPFPNLGSHVPDGWEYTKDHWLVDTSAGGQDREPALTVRRFRDELQSHVAEHPNHGFAITDEGQFQLVVSALARTREAAAEAVKR
jgi:hypothetical protein